MDLRTGHVRVSDSSITTTAVIGVHVEHFHTKEATIQSPGGWSFLSRTNYNVFISTRLGGALKIINFIVCLYRSVLGINCYLFYARNYLFQKYSSHLLDLPMEIIMVPYGKF